MQLSLTFPTTQLQGAFPANVEILFGFLDVNSKFADWITRRISQYDFIENQDYIVKTIYTKGRPRKEYFITLDMAKELCMVENNEKGKQTRRYFIECEKELRRIKFSHYIDKISNLNSCLEDKEKHHHYQIIGYKSQISQKNTQLAVLKDKLVKYESNKDYDYKASFKKAIRERDYYFDEFRILQNKENKSVLLLNNVKSDLEKTFSKIVAIMSYINDNDEFFINRAFKEIGDDTGR